MQSKAKSVKEYLSKLPADRRDEIQTLRDVVLQNLPKGYEEGMQYGMIGYYVPHNIYPPGYHCDPKQPLPFAGIASQKNHLSLYLSCLYGESEQEAWFRAEWAKSGKKLDMGKACIRFKKAEDVPLDVIGEAIRRVPVEKFISHYETAIKSMRNRASATRAPKGAATEVTGKTSRKSKVQRTTSTAPKASPKRKA